MFSGMPNYKTNHPTPVWLMVIVAVVPWLRNEIELPRDLNVGCANDLVIGKRPHHDPRRVDVVVVVTMMMPSVYEMVVYGIVKFVPCVADVVAKVGRGGDRRTEIMVCRRRRRRRRRRRLLLQHDEVRPR